MKSIHDVNEPGKKGKRNKSNTVWESVVMDYSVSFRITKSRQGNEWTETKRHITATSCTILVTVYREAQSCGSDVHEPPFLDELGCRAVKSESAFYSNAAATTSFQRSFCTTTPLCLGCSESERRLGAKQLMAPSQNLTDGLLSYLC